jgi:hypothetical protein
MTTPAAAASSSPAHSATKSAADAATGGQQHGCLGEESESILQQRAAEECAQRRSRPQLDKQGDEHERNRECRQVSAELPYNTCVAGEHKQQHRAGDEHGFRDEDEVAHGVGPV